MFYMVVYASCGGQRNIWWKSNKWQRTLFRVGNATSGGGNLHMVWYAFKIVVRYIRCEEKIHILGYSS